MERDIFITSQRHYDIARLDFGHKAGARAML